MNRKPRSGKRKKPDDVRPVADVPCEPAAATGSARGRFRGWRGWLLRIVLVVASPVVFFGGLEGVLRLAGYGYPAGFFVGPDDRGLWHTNEQFGRRFFPRRLVRSPSEFVLGEKPPDVTRIFVLGSSAAMGTPDEAYGLARMLAVMLEDRFPGRRFEVLNGAMVAINSHVGLQIARDCAEHQPDLFVVYMGNNEVIGPYGPATVFQKWSPNLATVRANVRLKATRVGQLLDGAMTGMRGNDDTPSSWQGLTMFVKNRVTADDPRLPGVYENYRRNLLDICAAARRAHAGVVLSTVAVNLKDCPPMASVHRDGMSAEELTRWEALVREGSELEAANRLDDAVDRYTKAAGIDDRHAELPYRMGRCLAAAGKMPEARECFVRARDLDALRFRADFRINSVVREVAAQEQGRGVTLADAEQAFARNDDDTAAIPGAGLFHEHVHFTFDGNYRLARVLVDAVSEALPALAASGARGAVPTREECARRLALTPWDEAKMAKTIVGMTRKKPFTDQLDHDRRQSAAVAMAQQLQSAAETPEAVERTLIIYQKALAKAPGDYWLHAGFGDFLRARGRNDEAVTQYREALQVNPHATGARARLGDALAARGETDAAIAAYQEVLKRRPDHVEVLNNLGNALAGRGHHDQAIDCLREALAISPDSEDLHGNLGRILAARGQVDEAAACFRQALELNPDHAESHRMLAGILADKGQVEAAIDHLRKALESEPSSPLTHQKLGKLLAARGLTNEAINHFRKALELRPDLAEAHASLEQLMAANAEKDPEWQRFRDTLEAKPEDAEACNSLGIALAGTGRFDEAIEQFEKSLKIRPDDALVHNNLGLALAGRGRADAAIGEYRKALEIKPDHAEACNNLGNALAGKGEIDAAITQYQRALEINANFAEAHNNLGIALGRRGEIDAAIPHFRKALEIDPNYAEAHNSLGIALGRTGNLDEAAAHFRKALEIRPDYAEAKRNLGVLHAMGGNPANRR